MTIKKIKSYFPANSLKVQLLSRSLFILAVLLVLIGLFQYVFMRDVVYRNKAESLRSQIASIPRNVWQLPENDLENENNLPPPRFFIPDASLVFIDVYGNYSVLSNDHNNINPPILGTNEYLEAFENKSELHYKIVNDAAGKQQLVVLQRIGRPGEVQGIIQISTLTNPLKELLVRQLFTFLFLALIALIIGLLAFLPVLKKTLIPLSNMVDTTEQIDAGNLDRRFPVQQGQIEIDRLAESFNGMLERLEASFTAERETKEQMSRFIADASHELRTPLTSIHGFLEVLLRGAANQPDQLDKALTSMYGESKRLIKLVQGLLLLA
ncbi:MAG: histidine kinase dimerization/phospho-acceptor domain-containing protein, partial [Syntrophomonas sp.]